jgi:hypothetical protein
MECEIRDITDEHLAMCVLRAEHHLLSGDIEAAFLEIERMENLMK